MNRRRVEKFEDLEVWQEGCRLSVILYKLLGESKEYALRDQMLRAVVSIPSNIAEGFDRSYNKEFIRFLYIAKASCAELRTQLYIVQRVGLLESKQTEELIDHTKKISAMLHNLIQTRKEKFN
jgi:four helix bundle protein